MAYLAYYEKERQRHPELNATTCSFDRAKTAIEALAKHFDVKIGSVCPMWGSRTNGYFKFHDRSIHLNNRKTLTWRTVIHEFAHAWHFARNGYRKPVRCHGHEHAVLVDRLAEFVRLSGWPGEVDVAQAADVERRVNGCRDCGGKIERTGKRGRPHIRCNKCRGIS